MQPGAQTVDSPQKSPQALVKRPARFTFGLAGLLLIISLIGVSLGLLIAVPGLGIPVAVLGAPAAIRAWLVASRRREAGRPLDAFDTLPVFFSSLAVVTILVVASSVASVSVCIPVVLVGADINRNAPTFMIIVGCLLGFTAGGAVLFVLARRLWPYRERPRPSSLDSAARAAVSELGNDPPNDVRGTSDGENSASQ